MKTKPTLHFFDARDGAPNKLLTTCTASRLDWTEEEAAEALYKATTEDVRGYTFQRDYSEAGKFVWYDTYENEPRMYVYEEVK